MPKDEVKYLRSLQAIRKRAAYVNEAAKANALSNFDFHENTLDRVADDVADIIQQDFGPPYNRIPSHGLWQHFQVDGVNRLDDLLQTWRNDRVDPHERTRRVVDLFFVSVLLDGGAGYKWEYVASNRNRPSARHEGIALASLDMSNSCFFTELKSDRVPQVDAKGLQDLSNGLLVAGLQASDDNPFTGADAHASLLRNLGRSLLAFPDVYGETDRPGSLVDYMWRSKKDDEVDMLILWDRLQELLAPIWPQGTRLEGGNLGDAWPLTTLFKYNDPGNRRAKDDRSTWIQPFHNLTQFLAYSLMAPFERILRLKWINTEYLTGLPDCRNGGLFIDYTVPSLKAEQDDRGKEMPGQQLPVFEPGDDVIVEWRAMTIVLLDLLKPMIEGRLGEGVKLSMGQIMGAGTWKLGREIAYEKRPQIKSSPILIEGDGTVL